MKTSNRGFTLVEMLVIAPIVILAIGAFVTVIVSMVGEVLVSRSSNNLAYNVQDALNRIEQDVKLSSGYLAQNSITLDAANDQGYDDDAANFTNVGLASGSALILNAFATTGNPLSTTSSLVYLTGQPNACASSQISDNTPMTYNIVYYIRDNALWRRTIMPSNYAAGASVSCSTPWQQPSCKPANPIYTSTFCKADDIKLVDGVSSSGFTIQYFASESSLAADTAVSSTSTSVTDRNLALQSMTTVAVSINATQTVAGRSVERSGSLRTSRLDTNATAIATPVVDSITITPSNVAATYVSPGQITVSWDPNGASSYTLQYDTSSSFSAPQTVNNITTTSYTLSSLTQPRYYFRVQAVNTIGTSDWSSTVNAWTTIANGLVAWWPLNGNSNDASGNGFNSATNTGTLAIGQNGQSNNAYSFNGSSQSITVSSTFNVSNIRTSISVWVNSSTATNSGAFVKLGTNGYGIGMGASTFDNTSPGTKIIMLYEGVRWIVTSTDLGTGWHHLVMVIDGSGVPTAYRDGVAIGTYSGTGPSAPVTTTYIGAGGASGRFFNGRIDDVRVYSRELNATEIQTLYNAGAK